MSIESVMPSSHLILCHPLLLLPPIPPSMRVFSSELTLHIRWPKYWSFSFSISPSNEHPGLISFTMYWWYLLAVQGTLKSLLQHHSSKASILQHSAFFTVQLSHLYMTTGKTIALTRWTFVGKAMSLLFNMLSRLLITFLPRSKRLLISWLQSPSAVILEPPQIKSDTVSTVSPSICHEVMEPDAMILVFWILSFKPTFSTLLHKLTTCHYSQIFNEWLNVSKASLMRKYFWNQWRVLGYGLHMEKVSFYNMFSADSGEVRIIVTCALCIRSLKWTWPMWKALQKHFLKSLSKFCKLRDLLLYTGKFASLFHDLWSRSEGRFKGFLLSVSEIEMGFYFMK